MSSGSCKINIGFTLGELNEWLGGLNYFKNLFKAIHLYEDSKINPILFLDYEKDNTKIKKIYSDLTDIIESKALFKDKSILNKLNRKTLRYANKSFFYDLYFKLKNVNIISHSDFCDSRSGLKKINWIPDFQHIHLPDMFSKEELELRTNHYKALARESDIIILSSNDAYNDFKEFVPEFAYKGRILNFVSIPETGIYEENDTVKNNLKSKYNISDKFFYMPNQFWKHKNHKIVFEAVKLLKSNGINVQAVFTGHLSDYRSNAHIQELFDFVKNNNLENSIKILGLIDYNEVQFLTRNCLSLINSSLFEGWNTMVEEAKSIGKNIILSDLKVHREQNPPEAIYFDPYNFEQLAEILKHKWINSDGGSDYRLEEQAKKDLNKRIIKFAKTYEDYILEIK